ncbi:hypothetical protein ACS0TY_013283 [Phlomoides rotata]
MSCICAAIDLVSHKQVDAIVGTLTVDEAALLSEFTTIPIISLSSSPSQTPPNSPSFIQMSPPITYQMQCISAIIAHFRWRKAILIHEQGHTFSEDSSLFASLSYSLQAVDSSIERHIAVPRLDSSSDPKAFIREELKKLRSKHVRIFIVARSSLEFAVILFEEAKVLGMMGKGYVWIVGNEISNLLDSVDASTILNMQGVLGLKTDFADNSDNFRQFKSKFIRKYSLEYQEEENPNPSIYSVLSYDAIWTIINAEQSKQGKIDPTQLVDFHGLSGDISFKNGFLPRKPDFRIINVIGKSYREVALWSPDFGFSEDVIDFDGNQMRLGEGLTGELSSIYWPGGELTVPKGWSLGTHEKPLRIGVPAKGAFHQFVKVTHDHGRNQPQITGFSIEVFEAAVKKLPYDLHLDAAVGDTDIIADRYEYAEFSQPFIESGLVMVVTVKPGRKESKFIALNPFTKMMWIQLAGLSMFTGLIIWFSEYSTGNEQFVKNSFLEAICSILWLSVTIISFAQREHIKNSASKLVLAAWMCVVFVVGASFTAVLSSMMTVPRLQPSVQEIDFLRNTNAVVGCNGNSFIVRYMIDVLHFKPDNVLKINSVNEYPQAFESGKIKAAFLVAPHAKVFLAEYCNGYTVSGPSFKLGGFGFVFQKGSPLAIDMSEAILRVTQSGHVDTLEQNMLRLLNCTTSSNNRKADDIRLGPGPFCGLFQVLGGILGVVFIISFIRLLRMRWSSVHGSLQVVLMKKIDYVWQCYTRFGSTFSRQKIVRMNVVDTQMEPNLVEIQMAVNYR